MRLTLSFLLFYQFLYGQFDHIPVFQNLNNDELQEALVQNFKTQRVLELDFARDTLYRRVYLYKDSVRCVYSGLTRFLDLSLDPSQALFGNGNNTDINLEHSYPRSKGAQNGLALSDMHALFPTRVPVNSARASKPFAEIVDNQTDTWYWEDRTLSSPPNSNRDLYAEDDDSGFEPREDFKGNVARAAFYFYTMYRAEANQADPVFFENQRSTLCDWHDLDPVDSLEWVRNEIIASFQDNKLNPFILDCSLARLYCNDISPACRTVNTNDPLNADQLWNIYPNPVSETLNIVFNEDVQGQLFLRNMQGQLISQRTINGQEMRWPIQQMSEGIYLLTLWVENEVPRVLKVVVEF